MIESSNNQQIKYIQHLRKSKFRKKEETFFVEGYKMVSEALFHNMVKQIYVSKSKEDEARKRWPEESERIEIVSDKLFDELSDTVSPQGVLALVRMPKYQLEDYLGQENAKFLCLEDMNDPGNLGTVMRTAEGAGMTGIIMSKGTVDLFNPKVVRSTMGSLFRIPFFYVDSFVQTMELLKSKGTTLYAAHLQGSVPYDVEDYKGSVGILIGNEANGLSFEVTALADKKIRIPMEGKLESLNAAVSAALLMYEVARKRRI